MQKEKPDLKEVESISADPLKGLRRGYFEEYKEDGKVTGYRIGPSRDELGSGVIPDQRPE